MPQRAFAGDDHCTALKQILLPAAAVSVEALAGGFITQEGIKLELPPFCRVRGISRPTDESRIAFELWMPQAHWNGRYYQLGNGGFAGNIHFPSLAAEIRRGNAVAMTDTGHEGNGFDASWAKDHPERIIDYGYRSIKTTSDLALIFIQAYYGSPPRFRYFAGCSNGGRQALMAAQRFPDDWDGIVAGAPANLWTRQLTDFARIQHHLRNTPEAWLLPEDLAVIRQAALSSCPAGAVQQGFADDPRHCPFDPAILACGADQHDNCLKPAQVDAVRFIQHAGFEPASASAENWGRWIVNPDPAADSQLTFAAEAFRYLLRDQPDWRIADFDPARDVAAQATRRALDADALDLHRFRDRGGRIISYFGWHDAVISPHAGADYFRRVTRNMGGIAATQAFYRLFMVPGMEHCQGGPGAYAFGQSLTAPAAHHDRRYDIRLAIEAWVEKGIAPKTLVAVRYRDSAPAAEVAIAPLMAVD